MVASSASFPRRKEEEEEEEDAFYEDEEFAPMDASSPRFGERGREQQKDEENATAASENNNKSNMGSRKSSALEELNQDGYFGSADGNWIEDDAAPLVLMQKSNTMDAPTLKEDMRELWRFYGKKIVVSALAVGILIASIAIVSMQTSEKRSPNSSSDMYKKSPWAGFDVSPAELRWYWGYKWERIPSECAMPEAPYETDDIAFRTRTGMKSMIFWGREKGIE